MSNQKNDGHDREKHFAEALEAKHAQLISDKNADRMIADEEDARIQSAMMVLQLLEDFKPHVDPSAAPANVETMDDPSTKRPLTDSKTSPAPANPSTQAILPDLEKLGRFEIIEQVGRGGFGIVIRARDPKLDRDVAIKIPRLETALSQQSRQRFEREARAAAAINHPNIVSVFESGVEQGLDFIVTEFVDGDNLSTILAKGQTISAPEAAELTATLAEAMQQAHQRGVLHRDLKPGNILLRNNDLQSPLIADFGLASVIDDVDFTVTGAVVGTPVYMSPEQASGKKEPFSPATDVYGLGTILYQLLTGRSPFADLPLVEVLDAVRRREPESPRSICPEVPRDLESICLKCLEKDPAKRYASALELQADLRRHLDGQTVIARRIRAPEKMIRWVKRNPLVGSLSIGFAVTILIALMATTILWRQSESNRLIAEQNKQDYLDKSKQLTEVVNRLFVGLANNSEIQEASADGLRRILLTEANRFQQVFLSEAPDDPELIQDYARSLFRLAEINSLLGDLNRSMDLTDTALEQSDRLDGEFSLPAKEVANWYTLRARNLTLLGEFDEAKNAFQQAADVYQDAENDDDPTWLAIRANQITEQADSLVFQQKIKDALPRAEAAIELWKQFQQAMAERDDPTGSFNGFGMQQAKSHYVLAETRRLQGKFDDAIESYTKSLELYDSAIGHAIASDGTKYSQAKGLRGLGLAYAESRQYEKAAESYAASLDIADEIARDHPKVESYVSLAARIRYSYAATEYVRKNFEQATKLIEQNIIEKKSLVEGFEESRAKYLSMLGDSYNLQYVIRLAIGETPNAELKQILMRAIEAFEDASKANPDWMQPRMAICRSIVNLGHIHYQNQDYDGALDEYEEARRQMNLILEDQPDWFEVVDLYYVATRSMAFTHVSADRLEQAIKLLDSVVKRFPRHRRVNSTVLLKPRLLVRLDRDTEAKELLESFVDRQAKSPIDFVMAAEESLKASRLDELAEDADRQSVFSDLALSILIQGRPADSEKLENYIERIRKSSVLGELADQVREYR